MKQTNPVRIAVCPDSFKGTLSAEQAAQAMARGVRRVAPFAQVDEMPLADGGEGTAQVVAASYASRASYTNEKTSQEPDGPVWHCVAVSSLDGLRPASAFAQWAELPGGVAVLDVASACGHGKAAELANPALASSFAAGELLLNCARTPQIHTIYLGLGGSATNDCGLGLLQALGARITADNTVKMQPSAQTLGNAQNIDLSCLDCALFEVELKLLLDVDNPLLGPEGATNTFGPQKGLTTAQLPVVERAMRRAAELLHHAAQAAHEPHAAAARRTISHIPFKQAAQTPGAGAAGGLGFALMCALGAEPLVGSAGVLELIGGGERIAQAQLCITGEGSLDAQTAHGKVIAGVVRAALGVASPGGASTRVASTRVASARGLANAQPTPVGAVCGKLELSPHEVGELGLFWAESCAQEAGSVEAACERADELVEVLTARLVARWISAWAGGIHGR